MNNDGYLRSMKQAIDESIKEDKKIQQFLLGLHKKTTSLGFPYQESALRAFYCAVVEGTITSDNREISRMLDSNLDKDIDKIREIADQLRKLWNDGNPVARWVYEIESREPAYSRFPKINFKRLVHQVETLPAVDIVVDRNLALACKNPETAPKEYLRQAAALLIRESDKQFQEEIMYFISIFPDREVLDIELYERYREEWKQMLGSSLSKHRNLKLDWLFSNEQQQLLKQYYAANKLLLGCLEESNASPEVRQEIHETLLLPIAEIEKRKSGINKKSLLYCSQASNGSSEVQDTKDTLLPTVEIEKRSSNEVQQQVQKTLSLPTNKIAQLKRDNKQSSRNLSVKTDFYTRTLFYCSLLVALILYIVFITIFRHYMPL
jgi:hypothetical protein